MVVYNGHGQLKWSIHGQKMYIVMVVVIKAITMIQKYLRMINHNNKSWLIVTNLME